MTTLSNDDEPINITAAYKALWLLYYRGRWNLLEELGLNREETENQFIATEMLIHRNGNSDTLVRRLTTQRQVQLFVFMVSGVTEAAIELLRRYMTIEGYYNGLS